MFLRNVVNLLAHLVCKYECGSGHPLVVLHDADPPPPDADAVHLGAADHVVAAVVAADEHRQVVRVGLVVVRLLEEGFFFQGEKTTTNGSSSGIKHNGNISKYNSNSSSNKNNSSNSSNSDKALPDPDLLAVLGRPPVVDVREDSVGEVDVHPARPQLLARVVALKEEGGVPLFVFLGNSLDPPLSLEVCKDLVEHLLRPARRPADELQQAVVVVDVHIAPQLGALCGAGGAGAGAGATRPPATGRELRQSPVVLLLAGSHPHLRISVFSSFHSLCRNY